MTDTVFNRKLTNLKRKLFENAKEVANINERGRIALKDKEQQIAFKGIFKLIDKYYSRFETLWDEINDLCEEDNKQSEFPTEADTTLQTKTKRYYFEAYANHEVLQTIPLPLQSTTLHNETHFSSDTRNHKNLPRINLPHFNGQITNWPKFRDAFTSIIHNDAMLSKMEKFHYLVSSLTGTASAVINNLPIIDDNYELAWTALNNTFNNKRILASAYLNQLFAFQPQQGKTSVDSIQSFLSQISDNISAFKLLNIPNETDFILFHIAVRLLDSHTREQFEFSHKEKDFPVFDDLTKFLRERCLSLQLASGTSLPNTVLSLKPNTSKLTTTRSTKLSLFTQSSSDDYHKNHTPEKPCFFCSKGIHALYKCKLFLDTAPAERQKRLQHWQGCRNCLHQGHVITNCKSKHSCRICKRKHHSLLHISTRDSAIENKWHDPNRHSAATNQEEKVIAATLSSTLSAATPRHGHVLLGTALAQIQDSLGNFQSIRLIVDSGSQHSFITKKCLLRLGLSTFPFHRKISAIGQTAYDGAKGKVFCCLKPRNSSTPVFKTEAVVIDHITSHMPNFVMPHNLCTDYMKFELADPKFWKSQPVEFLLGSDLFPDIWLGETITLHCDQPKLLSSVFGYIVTGRVTTCSSTRPDASFFTTVQEADNLHTQLQRFWELEEPVPCNLVNPEDASCEEHFQTTHYRKDNGQYVVRLPFKQQDFSLGNSYDSSLKRFHSLERRLDQNAALRADYSTFMKDYLDMGHMDLTNTPSKYIIPHHGITKEDRSQLKLRVVFDASATTSHSLGSLNDHLMIGPKLQKDIRDILLRFRLHPVAFVADVIKMYRQILVDPRDRPYQHIFWRFNNADAIKKYELNTVTYGLRSAPFLALRVMKQLELDEGSNFPKASSILSRDMYVDDLVTGASSVEDALQLQQEVISLLSKGQFKLSKWASNCLPLVEAANCDTQTSSISLTSSDENHVKILGLQWNPTTDVFSYKIQEFATHNTKRSILSTIAKIFDPLGFLAPSIFIAKQLIQDLWKLRVDWDAEIPPHLSLVWKNFVNQLSLLESLHISRWITTQEPYRFQLIGFSDASSKGYCAAIYLRVISNQTSSHLLTARTKLAPIKTISIPRLELCAAHLLAKTFHAIRNSISSMILNAQLEPKLFTDSSVVLGWLNTPSYQLKTFVANRVSSISDLTDITWWRHVISTDNPSDVGSRGLLPEKLIPHDLWWYGPKWLKLTEDTWPRSNISYSQADLPEMKTEPQVCMATSTESALITLMLSYSSYPKLLRVLSWTRRFFHNCQARMMKQVCKQGPLRLSEIRDTLLCCSKLIQRHYFYQNDRYHDEDVFKRFNKLSPFVDEVGVLRVGGRLNKADISYYHKHPILLPKSHFSILLVDYYHRLYLHPGPALLQALLQLKFWIPSLRSLVRQRTFQCLKCYKEKAKTFTPKMADLPTPRVTPSKAFLHVGVDFAGPLTMRESLRRKAITSKVYICLFVCLATKAVHLELVTSLTTDAFLAAFHRFTSRRGLPEQVYSDCGTNFQGAANRLRELGNWYRNNLTQAAIHEAVTQQEIQWNFNPPHAPHFGGLWEAAVKSTKTVLRKVAGDTPLTYEEMYTLLNRIEAVLNSRPLGSLSHSPNEINYLSPAHFLVGGPLLTPPQPSLLHLHDSRLSRWQHLQKMTQHFWTRWKLEYLTTLQRRNKWTKPNPNPQIGDVVLLKESNTPLLQWPLARIVQLHPSEDGIVRVLTVRTQHATLTRPAVKLIPLLPLSNDSF